MSRPLKLVKGRGAEMTDGRKGGAAMRPALTESRACFGLTYFRTEAEAEAFSEIVRARGDTFNGGPFHGMPCGRAREYDGDFGAVGYLYAVTTA